MAFLPNGSWVPDPPVNQNMNTGNAARFNAQAQMQPSIPAGAMTRAMPQNFQQMPMQMPQVMPYLPQMQTMQGSMNIPQFNPGALASFANPNPMLANPAASYLSQANQPAPSFMEMNKNMQEMMPRPAQQMDPRFPVGVGPGVNYTPMSPAQKVDRSDPQAVQNYLQSLQANKGNYNDWRNKPGAQGEKAQAGFVGFQQNGNPNSYGQPAKQYQQQNTQLGYQNNQATGGQVTYQQQAGGQYTNQSSQTGGVTPGATGGVAGQPQYTKAEPPAKPDPNQGAAGRAVGQAAGNMDNIVKEANKKKAGYAVGQALSDVNSKQSIKDGEEKLQNFLDSLGVYDYEYKDSKYGEGRRISPMAQEIEKTPLGKAAISTNEEGYKMVDYGKLGGTMLASLALLNHKYNELEKQLKQSVISGIKNKGKK